MRRRRLLLWLPLAWSGGHAQVAHGPAAHGIGGQHPNVGWVEEHHKTTAPTVTDGMLRVQGNSRLYLVQDYQPAKWEEHKYIRLDLRRDPLSFTLDLSNVPCGCLACVYMVKMKDPSATGSNYWCARHTPRTLTSLAMSSLTCG